MASHRSVAFPHVALVRNIPHRDHPLGRYLKNSAKIELAADELRKHDRSTRRFALLHEIGHFWSVSVLGGETENATEEEFADIFAIYFIEPSRLTPTQSDFISKCFERNDQQKIEDFTDEVSKKLEEMLWKA